MWNRKSVEKEEEILKLRSQGFSRLVVAERAGVGINTVLRVEKRTGGILARVRQGRSTKHLSLLEREEISRGLVTGLALREIGKRLGRPASSICREVNRNGGRDHYRAVQAEARAEKECQRPKPAKLGLNPALRSYVEDGLMAGWSPVQISSRLKIDCPHDPEMRVSHETIYQSLFVQSRGALRNELTKYLRSGRKSRRHHKVSETRHSHRTKDMVNIVNRPPEVGDRSVPGHWEGDLIVGKGGKSAVATLVERSTRFLMLAKLDDDHTAETVTRAIASQITRLPHHLRKTLTWDQGIEMALHKRFSKETGIDVYFCDPHSPWQRGSNENTNGLVRQYMPKSTDLSVHSQQDLDRFAALLNGRPRQTLDWRKPEEKLAALLALQ